MISGATSVLAKSERDKNKGEKRNRSAVPQVKSLIRAAFQGE